jgi:phosphoglycerol transferase MdoB-like AlkP superfamily enzyme
MKGGFGVDDETLFNNMVDWLKKYPGDKPFLMTISTIDSHPPFKVRYKIPSAKDNTLLNSFYSTDRALSIFWEYFKQSKFRTDTVVIVLADHAMGNNKDYNEFVAEKFPKYYSPFIDRIPCFMYFPDTDAWRGAVNSTSCTNLDLVPTILDMMNLDLENPFIGLSIFSERDYFNRNAPVEKPVDLASPKILEWNKKINNMYRFLYKKDRILPETYKVRFN